jgi:hypothetical protein
MFTTFTKLSAITAAEAIQAQRKVALTAIEKIPHAETKTWLTNITSSQFSWYEGAADQLDKGVRQFKETFKVDAATKGFIAQVEKGVAQFKDTMKFGV